MKLDILIPKYKEDEKQIGYLLNTIAYQRGIDFGEIKAIIYNDGGIPLSKAFIESFPYRIDYYSGEHKGVSATRNELLSISDAEYVMCCDADDMFIDMRGLYYVFKAIEKGFDVFSSTFIEESRKQDGRTSFVTRQNDIYFVHGKVFRRTYLIENDIHWIEDFPYSGDTYFLGLALRTNKKHTYCSTPFYMWKWNDKSLCRGEKDHYARELEMKIRVVDRLVDELLRRNMEADACNYALFVVYDSYYMTQTESWDRIEKERKKATINRLRDFYKKNRTVIESASKKARLPVIRSAKFNQVVRGNIMERITYDNWLKEYILND